MIFDFNETDPETPLHADLCIIGGGAAGITIARELAGSKAKVIVLESGGVEFEQATQDLYAGKNVGLPYNFDGSRLRYFGGTTNHWGGVSGPLDELDFNRRSWVSDSGWPLTRSELIPFYKRAQNVVKLGPFLYGPDVWDYIGGEAIEFDPGKVRSGFAQLREFPVRFADEYGDELRKAENIQLFLHANVVNIVQTSDARRVSHVDVKTLQGKRGRVAARHFVLACGALENARLLLVSNSQEPAGVGNRNDLVGRYFQEHLHFLAGEMFPKESRKFRDRFSERYAKGIRFSQHAAASPDLQTHQRILNCKINVMEVLKHHSGMEAVREVMAALRSKDHKLKRFDEKIWRILADLDDVAKNFYRRLVLGQGTRPPIERIDLEIHLEQAPNPDSRVTLLPDKDALGLNRVRLNWVLKGDLERRSAVTMTEALAAEFGRLGMGRVKLNEELLTEGRVPESVNLGHHMGTTRMADEAARGVVDRTCLVHGLSNLFVAGSSVFPTSGFMNPTLTIVAMALRLSDHLRSKLN